MTATTENATAPVDDSHQEKISKTGDNIMKRGKVVKFLVRQVQRNHKGDTGIITTLLLSIAATNSLRSAGIQPAISGDKGEGKSDAAIATSHIIPSNWKVVTSISAKTPYYIEWKDGIVVISDDIEWSPELIHTLKRSMGNFQDKQNHTTLDKNLKPITREMASRISWWLTSVDSVANDQLIDRQYSLDIDSSYDHALKVSNFIKNSRANKYLPLQSDWKTEVARYIIGKIKDHDPFKVIIPCAEKADWKLTRDYRTQKKFWDTVEALAILQYGQRYIDKEGWLYATKRDFIEAQKLFANRRKSPNKAHQ